MKTSLKLPREFVELCERDCIEPEVVLRGFIADLCGIINWAYPDPAEGRPPRTRDGFNSNGSDERSLAREYYDRVGYPYRAVTKLGARLAKPPDTRGVKYEF